MKLLPFDTYESARAADLRAFAFLKQKDGTRGGEWSGVFSDGERFGIMFSPEIADAFTAEELQRQDTEAGTVYGAVIQEPRTKRDTEGNIITPGWELYAPPVPEETP